MARTFRLLGLVVLAGTVLAIVNKDVFGTVIGAICLSITVASLRIIRAEQKR